MDNKQTEKEWKKEVYNLYGHGGIKKRYFELIEEDLNTLKEKK